MIMRTLLLAFISLFILACGEGKVSVDPNQYEAKISVEGILVPHQKVERIFVWRNFRVDANLQQLPLALPNADVFITDLQTGTAYRLQYNPQEAYFEYIGTELQIDYGKSYRLDARATIDGLDLETSATTTVPNAGLNIVTSNFDSLKYYQRDDAGNLLNFDIIFERSPGTNFYLSTALAIDADLTNFVYENPFEKYSENELRDDFDDRRYEFEWIQDTPLTPGQSNIELFWWDLWFYSRYRVIIYAIDGNYQDFLRTYDEVEELDGNYHEPVFHFEGDGIGVFGSAVADTIYLKVTQ